MTYKGVSLGVLTLFTGILCFFTILLSTPWGTQFTFFLVSGSSLQVDYRSGALLNDLQLTNLTIKNDEVAVNANNIQLQFHLRCLWKKQLCIDALSIGSLQIDIKDNGSTPSDELIEEIIIPAFLPLPFSIKMKRFSLAKVQINNEKLAIKLTHFSSALAIDDSAITIEKATLATATITLAETKKVAVQPIQKSNSPWPLAVLPKVSLPFKLSIKSFAVKKFMLNEQVTEQVAKIDEVSKAGVVDGAIEESNLLQIENVIASLSWFKTKLTIDTLSSTITTVGDVSLKGSIDLLSPYRVDLTLLSSIKSEELLSPLNDSTQKILLQGDLSRLAITASSQGALALTTQALIDITTANLPYKLAVNITKLTLPSDITKVITPITFSLKSQGDVNQQVVNLNSEFSGLGYNNVTLTLDAQVDAQLHNRNLKINALHLQDSAAKNVLNMTGKLNLGKGYAWDLQLDSTGITLPDIDQGLSGRVQGNINSKGFWHDEKWAISVVESTVSGEINNIKLNASANVDINHKGELAPSELLFDYGDVALKLAGYSDKKWHVDGAVSIGNTNSWLKDIEGSLQTKIGISGLIEDPNISVQGTFKKLFIANLADHLASEAISFEASYRPMNNHQHQVAINSALMRWNDHTINKVKLSSNGDLAKQQVSLAWFGDSSVDLLLDSHYSPAVNQWDIQTKKAMFALGEYAFESSQSIHLLYKATPKTLAINKHCWLEHSSQLCLSENTVLNLAKGKLPLSVKVNTELLTPFLPKEVIVDSLIDGSIAIGWQAGNPPSVEAKLAMSAGHIQMTKEGDVHKLMAWQKGLLNLTIHNNNVKGDIVLSSLNGTPVLKANTAISLVDNSIVNSAITINDFSIAPLQIFVPELSFIEGKLNTELAIAGNLEQPIINGKVSLTDGKTKVLGDINSLENINMLLDFNGQQVAISGGLTINNDAAALTGDFDWQNELQGNINVDGESLSFSIPPDLTLTVSPHLNAQLKASELKLSGRIEVLKGKLSVDKLPQGSVSLSQDVIIVNDAGEQVINEKRFNILTNVRVVISDAFQIEGQGFVGRIGGELQVSQQSQQPLQLFGSLKIPKGRYRAYGQDLSITKGNISFNGPVKNPYVSMQATRSIEKEDIIVGIDATGLANSLQIKLFSKPVMQQSEILSYLVRGRGLDVETSGSNAALGLALGTVITNYSGVLTQIEKLPLINRIEIDGDDEEASIAGYIGDQVYIKYGIGVVEPINELTVRFYFFSRLWVEAVSGLESSANIYYSFDIN